MGVKIVRRGNEPVGWSLKKLKRLMVNTGMMRELRKRQYFIKPSEKRREKLRRRNKAILQGNQDNGNGIHIRK